MNIESTIQNYLLDCHFTTLHASHPREQGSWGQHGAHLGPVRPDGPHVGPMNLAIREGLLQYNIDALVQERRNSRVLAMDLRLSGTNPSIYPFESYLKLKSHLPITCCSVDKLRAENGSESDILSVKFQNDSVTELSVMNDQDFNKFEFTT